MFRRRLPDRVDPNGNREPPHRPERLTIRPGHQLMDMLELSFSAPGQLRYDLHHPVRSAFGEGRYEYVLRAGSIVLERVRLLQTAKIPLMEPLEHAVGPPQLLEGPT